MSGRRASLVRSVLPSTLPASAIAPSSALRSLPPTSCRSMTSTRSLALFFAPLLVAGSAVAISALGESSELPPPIETKFHVGCGTEVPYDPFPGMPFVPLPPWHPASEGYQACDADLQTAVSLVLQLIADDHGKTPSDGNGNYACEFSSCDIPIACFGYVDKVASISSITVEWNEATQEWCAVAEGTSKEFFGCTDCGETLPIVF